MGSIAVTPEQVREAKKFLQNRNLRTTDVSPKKFARLSRRINKSFIDTLRLIAVLQMKGQGQGQAEESFREFGKNKYI